MPDGLLLLDTHSWLWAQLGLVQRFSRAALATMLEKRGRPALSMNVRTWVEEALSKPGVSVAPLTPEIAIESVHLPGDLHGDPADRMLAATARVLGATLLTKDTRLIRYARQRHVKALEA